jgi:ABC-type glycerol-3-phosphate transport system substrate-binding protein
MRRSLALCLLVALVLAGCTVAPKAKPETKLTGTVRVLVIGNSGLESTLFSAFTKTHPDVKPETVALGDNDDFTQTVAKIKSGEIKIDAFVAPSNSFLFGQGVVAPLDDLVKKDGMSLAEYGTTLDMARFQGKLMGLPMTVSPMVVVYNKDMLEQAGLKAPAAGWGWDEFEKDIQALTKLQLSTKSKAWGGAIPPWTMADLVLTAGKGPADPDLKPVQSTIEMLQRLWNGDRLLAPTSVGSSTVDYFTALSRGEIGMLLTYWETSFGHSDKPTFKWSVAPMPGGGLTPGLPTLAMMSANAENKANAEAFVKWAGGKSGSQLMVTMPGAPVPGYTDDALMQQWFAHSSLTPDYAWMLNVKYQPPMDFPEGMAQPLLTAADEVLQGKKSAADAIKEYEQARAPLMSKK